MSSQNSKLVDAIQFDKDGLVPVIAQDAISGKVLMLAYMNQESLEISLKERKMCYWSRSRQSLWRKGETSGNWQEIVDVYIDCDGDALIFKINQTGGACHTGYESCFFRKVDEQELLVVVDQLRFNPETVYKNT